MAADSKVSRSIQVLAINGTFNDVLKQISSAKENLDLLFEDIKDNKKSILPEKTNDVIKNALDFDARLDEIFNFIKNAKLKLEDARKRASNLS